MDITLLTRGKWVIFLSSLSCLPFPYLSCQETGYLMTWCVTWEDCPVKCETIIHQCPNELATTSFRKRCWVLSVCQSCHSWEWFIVSDGFLTWCSPIVCAHPTAYRRVMTINDRDLVSLLLTVKNINSLSYKAVIQSVGQISHKMCCCEWLDRAEKSWVKN